MSFKTGSRLKLFEFLRSFGQQDGQKGTNFIILLVTFNCFY